MRLCINSYPYHLYTNCSENDCEQLVSMYSISYIVCRLQYLNGNSTIWSFNKMTTNPYRTEANEMKTFSTNFWHWVLIISCEGSLQSTVALLDYCHSIYDTILLWATSLQVSQYCQMWNSVSGKTIYICFSSHMHYTFQHHEI